MTTLPRRSCRRKLHTSLFALLSSCLITTLLHANAQDNSATPPPLQLPMVPLRDQKALNLSSQQVAKYISKNYDFCIIDTEAERHKAFVFDADNRALAECSITGRLELRLCQQGELETYLHYAGIDSPVPDNVNCNSTYYLDACHPGFASSIDPFQRTGNGSVDPQNPIPVRGTDSSPCCRGFFCPEGLACMIPCPLGSFCPSPVEADPATGLCLPYNYEPVKGSGALCGGADHWGVAGRNDKIFCPAKSFCPSTIEKYGCRQGHYCRKGTIAQKPCSLFTACPANTDTQDLHAIGFVLILVLAMLLVVIFKCSDRIMSIRHRRKATTRLRAAAEAREHVSALERWKQARGLAKRAINSQAATRAFPFSRTFSRSRRRNGDESGGSGRRSFRRKAPYQDSEPTEGTPEFGTGREMGVGLPPAPEVSLEVTEEDRPLDSFQARLGLGPARVPNSQQAVDEDGYESYGTGGYNSRGGGYASRGDGYNSRGDGRYSTEGPTPSYTPNRMTTTPHHLSASTPVNATPVDGTTPLQMLPPRPVDSPTVDHSPPVLPPGVGHHHHHPGVHVMRSRTGPLVAKPKGRAGEVEVMPPYSKAKGRVHTGPIIIGERAPISSEDEVAANRGGFVSNSDSDDAEFARAPTQMRRQYSSAHSTPKLLRGLNPPEDAMDMYPTSPEREDESYHDLYRPHEAPPVPIPGFDGGEVRRTHDTKSQIFKYAYAQLEKERQMAAGGVCHFNDLLSGPVKDFLHNMQGMERHMIELEFRNLALTLKKNGKRVLSGVTGKLLPGRLTAVMGPSGAGKTMFLSAIAGKETHSRMSGKVYINGREESVSSYKKIIGYVSQDDIVHADLTVEENLWFSAKYRLPQAMPKREKVLIVERTIMALGLESVRQSRVGNVKSRGISGGQRKRVNVGIEMVMEPSLLILDEPTSGLDSTSSRLVVQALQREASRGVNVVVVLHQPNYGIFRMFDDLILFARGGRTAYLGPVDELEEYFDRVGFPVPERVNPPDHYMDVLEGIVRPADNDPQFDPDKLPLVWARYKGYVRTDEGADTPLLKPIPQKSMHAPPRAMPGGGSEHDNSYYDDSPASDLFVLGAAYPDAAPPPPDLMGRLDSPPAHASAGFFEEIWHEAATSFQANLETLRELTQKRSDSSGRRTPGFARQYVLILKRLLKQRLRDSGIQAQDYIIILMTSAFLGFLSTTSDDKLGGVPPYSNTILAFGLLVMLAALRTYSEDMLTFWRECASGINRVAYFLAKDTVDLFNVLLKPVLYLSMFYFFNNPRSTFLDNYVVTLGLCYCVTGFAYIFAILLEPAAAQLGVAFFAPVATLLGTQVKHSGLIWLMYNISYARWALEAYVIANAERYTGVWLLTRCALLKAAGYNLRDWWFCIALLFAFGIVTRIVALACLFLSHRDKQK